jgi:hypothetical protein
VLVSRHCIGVMCGRVIQSSAPFRPPSLPRNALDQRHVRLDLERGPKADIAGRQRCVPEADSRPAARLAFYSITSHLQRAAHGLVVSCRQRGFTLSQFGPTDGRNAHSGNARYVFTRISVSKVIMSDHAWHRGQISVADPPKQVPPS